jgi:beta-galactosidase
MNFKLKKYKFFKAYFVGFLLLLSFNCFSIQDVSTKQSFNDDWRFSKGELANAAKENFNDSNWQNVDLPHDWAIFGPFDTKYNARTGGLPVFGTAWYRKTFDLPKLLNGQLVSVTFDGVMDNSEVYVNGHFVGKRPFGYIGFEYDITPYLNNSGSSNVIAVKASPENNAARWYSGTGIYRNTWIEINDAVHVAKWGTFVSTPEVTKEQATVKLKTKVVNKGKASRIDLVHTVTSESGKTVAKIAKKFDLSADKTKEVEQTFKIFKPILWDTENPHRYKIVTTVIKNDQIVDTYSTPLGVRHIEFKANDGFWLNWRRVQIQGVCLHHDNGPIGAIANTRAIERKLEIMQEMGANSIRTSHNPPSPELVELADKMGILLQVEAFDMWKIQKPTIDNGYHKHFDEWHERDLRDMIIQHRNNPSVIMWSSGNEVMEQREQDGPILAKHLTEIMHDEDPTRLVTNGLSMYPDFLDNKLADELDIVGLNYKAYKYDEIIKQHPDWIMLGTETSSVVSTRGVYHFPIEKYRKHESKYVSSYDVITPPWAYIPDLEFENLKNNPAVMGEYIWTGFDYLGEPTPYGGRDHGNKGYWNGDWPARSSSFGAVDLVGLAKDRFYLYQSEWTEKPMVHVLPHWNWENKIGEEIPVVAYTNAESVELFVNGKSMGIKTKGVDTVTLPVRLKHDKSVKTFESKYRLMWNVEYQPGDIKVVAYNGNNVVAEKQITTAGAPYQIELVPDHHEITADGQDLSYVTVLIKDKEGNLCPNADNKVIFDVKGPAVIEGVGNGDSATVEPFKADYRRAFYGKAMLIIKSKKAEQGVIKIRAHSDRLVAAEISLKSI